MTRTHFLTLAILFSPAVTACGGIKKLSTGYQREILHKPEHSSSYDNQNSDALSIEDQTKVAAEIAASSENVFSQVVDHFDATNTDVFSQRYFVNSDYAVGTKAPVILRLCGESACQASGMIYEALPYAEKFGAHLISLEHRYYGVSFPVADTTTPNLKYLTSDQAIEDIATFIKASKADYPGPWVVLGGSYGGYLSARLRARHPELVSGSISSSAPMHWTVANPLYDDYVAKGLPSDCAEAARVFVDNLDQDAAAGNQAALDLVAASLGIPAGYSIAWVGGAVSGITATVVQYGYRMTEYCQIMQGDDPTWDLGPFYTAMNERFASSKVSHNRSGLVAPKNSSSSHMWFWQVCSEFGAFQVADTNRALSVTTAAMDLDYYLARCKRSFGLTVQPPSDATAQKTMTDMASASRILLLNGTNDPWSSLGITIDTSAQLAADIHTYEIAEGSHCDDLYYPTDTDPESVSTARRTAVDLLRKWFSESK